MPTNIIAGSFAMPAVDGPVVVTPVLPFEPVGYLLSTNGATLVETFEQHSVVGFGGTDGTNQGSISTFAEHLGSNIARRKQDSTAVLTFCNNSLGTSYETLTHTAFLPTGFSMMAANVDGNQRIIHYMAFGGDDIGPGDVLLRKITVPQFGLFTSDPIGFHANPIIAFTCGSDDDTIQTDVQGSIGFSADDAFAENRSISWEVLDGTGAVRKRTNQGGGTGGESDEGLWLFFDGFPEGIFYDLNPLSDIDYISSGNATLDRQWDFFVFCFGKGDDGSELGPHTAWLDIQSQTSAGTINRTTTKETSLPRPPYPEPFTFQPGGLIHLSTGGTSDQSARVTVGFTSGDAAGSLTGQESIWTGKGDATGLAQRRKQNAAFIAAREAQTQQQQGEVTAFLADGFEETWTQDGTGSPDATARDYLVLAIGGRAGNTVALCGIGTIVATAQPDTPPSAELCGIGTIVAQGANIIYLCGTGDLIANAANAGQAELCGTGDVVARAANVGTAELCGIGTVFAMSLDGSAMAMLCGTGDVVAQGANTGATELCGVGTLVASSNTTSMAVLCGIGRLCAVANGTEIDEVTWRLTGDPCQCLDEICVNPEDITRLCLDFSESELTPEGVTAVETEDCPVVLGDKVCIAVGPFPDLYPGRAEIVPICIRFDDGSVICYELPIITSDCFSQVKPAPPRFSCVLPVCDC